MSSEKRLITLPKNWETKKRLCACGCGVELNEYADYSGKGLICLIRKREFLHGHNKPWLGKHLYPEMRRAITLRQIGNKRGPMPQRVKNKIGKANKGKLPWCTGTKGLIKGKKGEESPNWKGGPLKCKICQKAISKGNGHGYCRKHSPFICRGENHYHWEGGKSFEPYGLEFNPAFKEQIRERDNHTCQECDYTEDQLGYKLHCHHIDYNKKNNHPNNLISLCRSCHPKTNFSKQSWERYYKNKLKGAFVYAKVHIPLVDVSPFASK